MADWEDVARLTSQLPEVGNHHLKWTVRGKAFAWDRPLRKRDLEELGAAAPEPPTMAAWVEDELEKTALIGARPDVYFTTSHFDGYAIVLVRLERIDADELEEILLGAWLKRAPKRLAAAYLDDHR